MENKDITQHITEKIGPFRKRSERIVGFVPYILEFEMRNYHGTVQKLEKVSILEKTIVSLIHKGVNNVKSITEYLGFDINDEIEKQIFNNSIESLKTKLQFIQIKSNNVTLTSQGIKFAQRGEYKKTFTCPFEIYYTPLQPSFLYMKDCAEKSSNIEIGQKNRKEDNLKIKQIRKLAENQASFVQCSDYGIQLQSTVFIGYALARMSFYVCFLQSIRDNSIRTIIYDDSSNNVIEELSQLFDQNENLRDSLLTQCLKNEEKENEAVKINSGEKSKEQIAIETKIIKEADTNGEDVSKDSADNYERKVGSVFGSVEFEKELYDIFEKHHNEEIWLISPWIRSYAFLRKREPMIRKFLDQGGAVFIGYSEPENIGEEMVDPKSKSVIERLDITYDKFYFAELPKFHYKNVIEHKGSYTTLYTGSFNVLSFCINGNNEHYRMEQMTYVNRREAKEKRLEYIKLFANKYVKDYVSLIKTKSPGKILNVAKLKYLKEEETLKNVFETFESYAKESNIEIRVITKPNEDGLINLAKKVLTYNYSEEIYHLQVRLAALLFLFNLGKAKKDLNIQKNAERELNRIVNFSSIYRKCRFSMRRNRESADESNVYIICNGFNFEFNGVSLTKSSFKTISVHKENINFKEENIKYANNNIGEILYNSAKSLDIFDD